MKKRQLSRLTKITLALPLPLILAAGLWVWLVLPSAQARNFSPIHQVQNPKSEIQNPEQDLWRPLETPFEHPGQVLEDKEGNIWVVSWVGTLVQSNETITDYNQILSKNDGAYQTQSEVSVNVVAIPGEGVAKFERGHWLTYTVESTNGALPGDSTHAATFDHSGNLWLAVAVNQKNRDTIELVDIGVVRFDGQNWFTYTITNTNSGLASNSVRDIFEDNVGNLWFATLNGLSCYDGQTWQVVANKVALGAEGVFRVFRDSQKRLWVSLFDFDNNVVVPRGVARSTPIGVDGKVMDWQTFTKVDGLADEFVLSIAEDTKGNIWLGTTGGVSQFDGRKWTTFNTESRNLPGNLIQQVVAGYEDQVWIATNAGSVRYVNDQWQSFDQDSSSLSIFKDSENLVWFPMGDGLKYNTGYYRRTFHDHKAEGLFKANNGIIWAWELGGGVSRYHNSEWQDFSRESGDLSGYVQDLFIASNGVIWVRTNKGVSHYQDGKWQNFNKESGDFSSNDVRDLFEASNNVIWAGLYGGGVTHYQDGTWQVFSLETGDLGSNYVEDLFEASDGTIWARMSGGGVSHYHNNQWKTFRVKSGDLDSYNVWDLFEASDGTIWAWTDAGVSRYWREAWETFDVANGGSSGRVPQWLKASDGATWYTLWNSGISRYQNGETQTFNVESAHLGSNIVTDLFETRDGAIWIGTWDGGVSRYRDGKWQIFNNTSGDLASDNVRGLFEAGDETIWIGTFGGGVSRYQSGKWKTFSFESGDLDNNDVLDLFEDKDESIWVRTSNGISYYRNNRWQNFARKNNEPFTKQSQLSQQLTDIYGFTWMVTDQGIVRSHLGRRQPWVEFTYVIKTPIITSTISLAYDDRRGVFVDFIGDDLATRPENLQYFYKLKNSPVFTDWQVATYNEPIFFEELNPGQHTLLLKAIDEDGNESELAKLDITVENPPPAPTPLPTPLPQIKEIPREVPVEPRYTMPGLGMSFTLPQLLGGGVGLVILLGVVGLGAAIWSKRQRVHQNVISRANPYIAGDPIDNPELFFGREELITKIIQGLPGNHIAIEGPRRSGKSSLLIQLAQRLRSLADPEYYFVPVLFDCHATTEADFFYDLMGAVLATLSELEPTLSWPPLAYQSSDQAHQPHLYDNRFFKNDLKQILATLAEKIPQEIRIVLLLDEGDALNEYDKVTQRKIRNLISQHKAIKMVWAGTNVLTAAGDPTSPWYNMQLTYLLAPLSEAKARELITRPADKLGYRYQEEAVQRILERAKGQPYIIQYLCYRAIEAMLDQKRATITLAEVETAIAQLEEEKSAQDPGSVVYQPRQHTEAALSIAEEPIPYHPGEEDDPS